MSYARKVDRNHAEVMDALRACGWRVKDTSRLPEAWDLTAQKAGRTVLIEVKAPKGKATKAQRQLAAEGWEIVVIRSADEAVRL